MVQYKSFLLSDNNDHGCVMICVSYFTSSSANVSGKGWLSVSGRERLTTPPITESTVITNIGKTSLYWPCIWVGRIRGGGTDWARACSMFTTPYVEGTHQQQNSRSHYSTHPSPNHSQPSAKVSVQHYIDKLYRLQRGHEKNPLVQHHTHSNL